jgi:hypothetical protein
MISVIIDLSMPKEISQVFARRARLSSKAIITAVILTLAALAAIVVASRQETKTSVRNLDPMTHVSIGPSSGLIPVVDR